MLCLLGCVKVLQILKNSHDCLKAEPFLVISVSAHFVMTALRVKYTFCLSTNCYGPVSSSQRHPPWCLEQQGHPQLLVLPLLFKPGKSAACGLVFTWSFEHSCPMGGCRGRGAEGDQQGLFSLLFSTGFPLRSVEKRCISRRRLRCSLFSFH